MSLPRLASHNMWMQVAVAISQRATCARRQVGCVLIDSEGKLVSTGYNGPMKGAKHCIDDPCPGAFYPSGKGLNQCEAVHAEQNAVLQATRNFDAVYCTTLPCVSCMKLFVNASVTQIFYLSSYAGHETTEQLAKLAGIQLVQL